jgi:hypothetical protein|tara:strand:- start:26 stop:157 length:132 start_codon:yes stop_codon:yes gene_type:complete
MSPLIDFILVRGFGLIRGEAEALRENRIAVFIETSDPEVGSRV